MKPVIQLALDFVNLDRALAIARLAVPAGVDYVEAGTPLIKSEGLDAVRRLRELFGDKKIVADMKTADVGRIETEMAAKAGADFTLVLGAASASTVSECIKAGAGYGIGVGVDLLGVSDYLGLAERCAEWGAAFLNVHCPIDEQMRGGDAFAKLRELAQAVGGSIPLAACGGINSESAVDAVEAGASIVIVGGAITKAKDPAAATADIRKAVDTGARVPTELFKRADASGVREVLMRVSTANISHGTHHKPCLMGLAQIVPNAKLVGPVVTVRTAPGDFSKPVRAIDEAEAGQVIAIDAGGNPPAVWGELATESALQRGLAGVVIDGTIRDVEEIRRLKFPAFARHTSSHCGHPKGFGETGQPIYLAGQQVFPGDWLVGDADGIMVLPKAEVAEMANRAQDIFELENRQREEIRGGKTLGEVAKLEKWEKKAGK